MAAEGAAVLAGAGRAMGGAALSAGGAAVEGSAAGTVLAGHSLGAKVTMAAPARTLRTHRLIIAQNVGLKIRTRP